MPWPESANPKMIEWMNLYYGVSQLFATVGVMNVSRSWRTDIELAFTTLFAVQISALLMTLVRKSIITAPAWHFYYAISLGLSWVLACYRYTEHMSVAAFLVKGGSFMVFLYLIRFYFDINKYLFWSVIAAIDVFVLTRQYHDFPFQPIF